MKKALLILVQIFFFAADANEETKENTNFFFDKPIAKSMNIQFKIEEDLYPD
jgi:hypothetical protein